MSKKRRSEVENLIESDERLTNRLENIGEGTINFVSKITGVDKKILKTGDITAIILYDMDKRKILKLDDRKNKWVDAEPEDIKDLGNVIKESFSINVSDFNNFVGPTRYDWTTPKFNQDGSISRHPPNFYLDASSGALYATLPYQPAYSLSYAFTVWVIKTDNQTGEETATARTFTLTVKEYT